MEHTERKLSFREAERRYDELKRRFEAGEIGEEEFAKQRREHMVRDNEGRWWTQSRKDGSWHYRTEDGWRKGTPPGEKEADADTRRKSEQERETVLVPDLTGKLSWQAGATLNDAGLSYHLGARIRSELPENTVVGQEPAAGAKVAVNSTVLVTSSAGRGMARTWVWVAILGGVLSVVLVVALIAWAVSGTSYTTVTDDTGALSMESPDDWNHNSSTLMLDGEETGAGLFAYGGDQEFQGSEDPWVFLGASRSYAEEYETDEDALDSWQVEDSDSCAFDGREDYSDGTYSGVTDTYSGCGPEDADFTVTMASPSDRGYVVVVETSAVDVADQEAVTRALETFEVDASELS